MSKRVRALLCDLDGVIRHWNGIGRTHAEETARLPSGTIRHLAYGMEFALANLGVYSHEEWLKHVQSELTKQFGPLAATAVDVWAADPGEVDQEMADLLFTIRDHGTPVGILTNNTSRLRDDLMRLGLNRFDAVINSAEEGVVKPEPVIYRTAATRLGLHPEEILFIDDKQPNVLAAKQVGMCAVKFTDIHSLIRHIRSVGITVE